MCQWRTHPSSIKGLAHMPRLSSESDVKQNCGGHSSVAGREGTRSDGMGPVAQRTTETGTVQIQRQSDKDK